MGPSLSPLRAERDFKRDAAVYRTNGGYAGYFQDLGRHLWEIAFSPAMLPKD